MMEDKKQWYSNKELFERIGSLKDDFKDLRSDMKETRAQIQKYNGLREEIKETRKEVELLRVETDDTKLQVQNMLSISQGKNTAMENLRNWGGWLVAIVAVILDLLSK